MFHGLSTVAFALAASISWGAGDFSGGLATRRTQVLSVVVGAYTVGLCMLSVLALIWSEPFPRALDLMWGGVAGVAGLMAALQPCSGAATMQRRGAAPKRPAS